MGNVQGVFRIDFNIDIIKKVIDIQEQVDYNIKSIIIGTNTLINITNHSIKRTIQLN